MRRNKDACPSPIARRAAGLAAIATLAAGLGGCGTVQLVAGRNVDTAALEGTLKAGISSGAEVKQTLGEPYGQGRGLMPFQDSERTVWTYFHERGSVDAASGQIRDQRVYLFVFLKDDRFDGYMWFSSALR